MDAEYATKLVGYLISTVIETVNESLSENLDEKAKKRIIKIVAAAGVRGVTRNEITRKTQFLRRSMREEYLQDLLDAETIRVKTSDAGHGDVFVLRELA